MGEATFSRPRVIWEGTWAGMKGRKGAARCQPESWLRHWMAPFNLKVLKDIDGMKCSIVGVDAMAFLRKAGSILGRTISSRVSEKALVSKPSIFQAIRCMSSSRVFIGGLSYNTNEDGLREAFDKYGEVVDARVIVDRDTGRSKGFGFVTYSSVEEASAAIQALDQQVLDGRTVKVNYANDRPRGGFSGGYGSGGGYGGGGGGGYGSGGGYGGGGSGYGGGSYGNYGNNNSYGGGSHPASGGESQTGGESYGNYGSNNSYGGGAGFGSHPASGGESQTGGGNYGNYGSNNSYGGGAGFGSYPASGLESQTSGGSYGNYGSNDSYGGGFGGSGNYGGGDEGSYGDEDSAGNYADKRA